MVVVVLKRGVMGVAVVAGRRIELNWIGGVLVAALGVDCACCDGRSG